MFSSFYHHHSAAAVQAAPLSQNVNTNSPTKASGGAGGKGSTTKSITISTSSSLSSGNSANGGDRPRCSLEFHTEAIPFLFDKKTKEWKTLGAGNGNLAAGKPQRIAFGVDTQRSSITVQRTAPNGEAEIYLVEPSSKIQASVAKSQSWVFRGIRKSDGWREVLCLQFPENVGVFIARYEQHREQCLEHLALTRKASPRHGSELLAGAVDLSAGMKTLSIEGGFSSSSTTSTSTSTTSSTITSFALDTVQPASAEETSFLRRRLTTLGGGENVDGYEEGARYEPVSTGPSPTKTSPLRPTSLMSALRQQASSAFSGGGGLTTTTATTTTSSAPSSHKHQLVSFSGMTVKGRVTYNADKPNQDALLMQQLPIRRPESPPEIVLSVFDGHGEHGHTISNHFKVRIPQLLAEADLATPAGVRRALRDALLEAEREIIEDFTVDTTLSGTTAVVTLLKGDKLYVANVGDSRAVFGRRASGGNGIVAATLTTDHKPDTPAERKRVEESGGRVFAVKFDDGIDGPFRVWLSYADLPGLAMSRSLCDTIAKEAGVISEPDIFEFELNKDDRFVVIASDGLWEFMSSEEVVEVVAKYASGPHGCNPEGAIRELVRESARRWEMNEPVVDDTTIIVAFFR